MPSAKPGNANEPESNKEKEAFLRASCEKSDDDAPEFKTTYPAELKFYQEKAKEWEAKVAALEGELVSMDTGGAAVTGTAGGRCRRGPGRVE